MRNKRKRKCKKKWQKMSKKEKKIKINFPANELLKRTKWCELNLVKMFENNIDLVKSGIDGSPFKPKGKAGLRKRSS